MAKTTVALSEMVRHVALFWLTSILQAKAGLPLNVWEEMVTVILVEGTSLPTSTVSTYCPMPPASKDAGILTQSCE